MAGGDLDDVAEVAVALGADTDVAGIDAILGQRLGAGGKVGEQPMADEVEVADQRHVDADAVEPLANARHGGGAFVTIDGDAHQFRAGPRKRHHLRHRCIDVGSIRVGHRLNNDGCIATDRYLADNDGNRAAARRRTKGVGHCVENPQLWLCE